MGACLLAACALLAAPSWAQPHGNAPGQEAGPSTGQATTTERPRIGLVLSGGGARGFAHVGVLKALEQARVPIDAVVGTSMGAIIGGLYASGMDATQLEREILGVDWNTVFSTPLARSELNLRRKEQDFDFSPALQLGFKDGEFRFPQGAVSSQSLELLLRRYTLHTRHLDHFNALPIPFRAVATDMETGQPVVLDSGDLAAALRASMSVPGVFAPLEWNGRILGDGGLVNNLPVDVARSLGVDVVIAVNIGTPLAGRDTLGNVVGVTLQMINILTEQNVRRSVDSLTPRDLLLSPPLGTLSSASFDRAAELVALGTRYADGVTASLERFALPPTEYAQWRAQREQATDTLLARLPQPLAFVRVEGVQGNRAERLQRQLKVQPGDTLSAEAIEQDLRRLNASEELLRLDYRLERVPGTGADAPDAEGLVYLLGEDGLELNQFRLGLDLQTDFQGQGDFRLRLSHNRRDFNRSGTQWRNEVGLGATVSIGTEVYQPLGADHRRFLSLYADHELRKIELFSPEGDPLALFRRRTSRIGIDHGWNLGAAGSLGELRVGLQASRRQSIPDYINQPVREQFGLLEIPRQLTWTESALRMALVTDQLDYANFPQQGYRSVAEIQVGQQRSLNERSSFQRWELNHTRARTAGRHTLNTYLRLAGSNAIPLGAVDEYSLGGFQQLSGYRVGQVAGNYLALARLTYYRKLEFSPGLGRAWFAGASLEAGNAWTRSRDIRVSDLKAGSSLFVGADTGIGPVYMSVVHAPQGYTGLYFLLGRP